ncbi:conserved hypothetical protein [Candida dubliniensis CD36]|uniref:Uncharacterized protein n=1 Tax=Candida dubliniensis (strain CD36 / ATCC MYA-646 / CBS 7987 / NCPF 3949 / NRRL Y-17841) TaxID=573826 RepID=B9WL55_CANDC|nr:conserved hypothetical protein [Candida dubliniensis CD36]CAX39760.1 conserved hypothetical protein [Candida dubliniensis CD36]
MSPHDIIEDKHKSFIHASPLDSTYPTPKNVPIISTAEIFKKSDPNANFITPTKPSRSADSNEDSIGKNDIEHVNGNGNVRQVSDNSDRLSLKHDRVPSTAPTTPKLNSIGQNKENLDFFHDYVKEISSLKAQNEVWKSKFENLNDCYQQELQQHEKQNIEYGKLKEMYNKELEEKNQLKKEIQLMNSRIEILEYGEENLKLLVDKYKEIATQIKENNIRSPSPLNNQDLEYTEELVNDLISFDNLNEEVKASTPPKKINHGVQTELKNFNVTAPSTKPNYTHISNKETQTSNNSSMKINKAVQTIQIQEKTSQPSEQISNPTIASPTEPTPTPTSLPSSPPVTASKIDNQTFSKESQESSSVSVFPEFSLSSYSSKFHNYYKQLHLDQIDELSKRDLQYLIKTTMCQFMIDYYNIDTSLTRYARFLSIVYQFLNELHLIIYPGQILKSSDYYRGRVYRDGKIDEEMIGLKECLNGMQDKIRETFGQL